MLDIMLNCAVLSTRALLMIALSLSPSSSPDSPLCPIDAHQFARKLVNIKVSSLLLFC